jgi:hypothetical protein
MNARHSRKPTTHRSDRKRWKRHRRRRRSRWGYPVSVSSSLDTPHASRSRRIPSAKTLLTRCQDTLRYAVERGAVERQVPNGSVRARPLHGQRCERIRVEREDSECCCCTGNQGIRRGRYEHNAARRGYRDEQAPTAHRVTDGARFHQPTVHEIEPSEMEAAISNAFDVLRAGTTLPRNDVTATVEGHVSTSRADTFGQRIIEELGDGPRASRCRSERDCQCADRE